MATEAPYPDEFDEGRGRAGSRLGRRWSVWLRRNDLFIWLELAAVAALVAMVVTTWQTFAIAPEDGRLLPSLEVAALLIGTLVPAMMLLVLIGRRIARSRAAGSTARLHVRLVFLFSLIAAVPTLLVAGFAAFLFQSGVDFWFSDSSRGLMENTNRLAESFYEDNQVDLQQETVSMAMDMRSLLSRVAPTDPTFALAYEYQAQPRKVNESAILQAIPDGSVRTAVVYGLTEGSDPIAFAQAAMSDLADGNPVVVAGSAERIEALAPIDREAGIYLYNARNASADSFASWESARTISSAYQDLTQQARSLQLRFNLALFFVSLGLVGFAVWFALRFADQQVEPLTDLVAAARRVGGGNFALRVEEGRGGDEIGLLNRAFNRMTAQIERQTDALVTANSQIEERRNFIEAVLESVSAGIMSIDKAGRVQLMNAPAQRLLLGEGEAPGDDHTLADIAPQISVMVEAGLEKGIVSHAKGQDLSTLAVKIGTEPDGYVITFEDITRQLLDQRQAAWSDVARRIAHEIKNPLTPIQLATERLKRRYRKQIELDGELFDELTDTIVRQVGDMRKMVDEFSSFARLPKPVFRSEDMLDLLRQALFLQEVGNPGIDYALTSDSDGPLLAQCDRHQVGQALTNVMKNAAEAIEARAESADADYRGKIAVSVETGKKLIAIAVEDNGIGLPKDSESLLEPYVTTREKGTGLGLAIVNKIVEEHGGSMRFSNGSDGGTRVHLSFARDPAPQSASPRHSPSDEVV